MMAGKTTEKKRITAVAQVHSRPPGVHSVQDGLYLVVNAPTKNSPKGARQWQFRFTSPTTRKRREMGLGSADAGGWTLAEARAEAFALKRMVREGRDPIAEREAENARKAMEPVATFGAYADKYIARHEGKWRNEKHALQWRMTMRVHAAPLRDKRLKDITVQDVKAVLDPIWETIPETAKRTQSRIESILDAATVEGLREGDNPARWKGFLSELFSARTTLSRGHHAALDYKCLPAFMAELRSRRGTAARALEFLILTAARSGEVRGARWEEIDMGEGRWTVPAERMKAKQAHEVPLCGRALAILREMQGVHGKAGLIFPGNGSENGQRRPLSDMTLGAVLIRMKYKGTEEIADRVTGQKTRKTTGITVHGFRSTFRDWAGDKTDFLPGVIEAALAHTIGNKTEAAYRRKTAYTKRADLMAAWEAYAEGKAEA